MNIKKTITLILSLIIILSFTSCNDPTPKDSSDDLTNKQKYTVIWQNYDGSALQTDTDVEMGSTPVYNGATPTKQSNGNIDYEFSGWSPSVTQVTCDATYTAVFTQKQNYDNIQGVKPIFSQNGLEVQYGLYPQTHINDTALIDNLQLSATKQSNGWYLYNDEFYVKHTAKVFNDENYAFDDGTVIIDGENYWFKCQPITWKVIKSENGNYQLLSTVLLDTAKFYNDYSNRTIDQQTVYGNNYEHSLLRSWLNDSFYDLAFAYNNSFIQTINVDNGSLTTDCNENIYASNDTQDKVYLLSYQDYINSQLGFENTTSTTDTRQCKTTDFARANGAWCNTQKDIGNSKYNGTYWTRSSVSEYYYCAWTVNSMGFLSTYAVDGDSHCVRPCITIKA